MALSRDSEFRNTLVTKTFDDLGTLDRHYDSGLALKVRTQLHLIGLYSPESPIMAETLTKLYHGIEYRMLAAGAK